MPPPCGGCERTGCPKCRVWRTNRKYAKIWGPYRPVQDGDATRQLLADGADKFVSVMPQYPGGFSGRGVVIAAGGPYWPGAYITAKMLRHVGCTLPVQVWHLDRERESEVLDEFRKIPDVEFVNADRHPARPLRRTVAGFGIKLFSVLHSPFNEVLFLDADNYPCQDPTFLFEDAGYKKTGAIYWPDAPHTEKWTNWPHWGVEPFGPKVGLETGQFLINKETAWGPLALADWYDDRPEWCYGHGVWSDHGDKGPHRVAWAKLKREFTMFSTLPRWKDIAFVQTAPNGSPLFVHRAQSKFTLAGPAQVTTSRQRGEGNVAAGLPGEADAMAFLAGLRASLGLPPAPPAPALRNRTNAKTDCIHLGPVLEYCTSCKGDENRHIRECAVHGKCTLKKAYKEVVTCQTCPSYTPDS
jgi:hypothetical protein